MTELETIQNTKLFLDKLARGMDPVTGLPARETDVINRVEVSRCLFFAADIMRQVLENGGVSQGRKTKAEKPPFALSPEQREAFQFSDSTTVSRIAQQLNDMVDTETMQRMKTVSILAFLVQSGLLFIEEQADGHKRRLPTAAGRSLGIGTERRSGQTGDYTLVTYSPDAQQLILDNLDAIIAINSAPRHENQGKPWSPEDDAKLRELVFGGAAEKELSGEFKRSSGAIRARIEKLGLR